MADDKEIQIQVKETPAFTVLKNGSILKNIFLLRKPSPFSSAQSTADISSINQELNEEVLLVGRHPDCNITLEHPSISRYHLRIHSNPSAHMLSIVDLSSVHGTWVSGKRIEPGIPVKLKEGDTVKMGGSSRVYELHWVPLSQAFDINDPFVPATFRNQEETQDESCSYIETHSSDDEDFDPVNHETTKAGPVIFSETVSATEISQTLNKLEDQSSCLRDNMSNEDDPFSVAKCLKSSCDDVEVEQLSPCKTGNDDGEIFATVSIQTPPVVPESISETDIFDSLNKSEDPPVAHKEDALDQDIARGTEIHQKVNNVGPEFGQINQTTLADESDSMVDTDVKFESVDHEIMKKEPVFLALLDETEQTFTPRGKQVSKTLFDSLDGKELEVFTPDKENRDPNACLMKPSSKKWKEDENKQSNPCTMLKEDVSPTVTEGRKDIFDLLVYHDEVLISSEKEATSRRSMKMEESGISNYPQTAQKVIDSSKNFQKGTTKRWTMVVDTNTLLHKESLKHLKLLQGLKGTQLFIPKTVLKELMDIKSQQHHLFNITTKKVSLALKWIEECMVTTRWWIHMDDEIEAESKVLETAIQLCKGIKDGKILILSNDVSLKIKAMAEGIMCEEAEEFFRSLVNPFSDRFMWVGSLARGPTWSCLDDDDVLREKYRGFGLNVSNRLKGLKLLV